MLAFAESSLRLEAIRFSFRALAALLGVLLVGALLASPVSAATTQRCAFKPKKLPARALKMSKQWAGKKKPMPARKVQYLQANGCWPTFHALLEFAGLLDIGLQAKAGRPWSEWIEEARAYRESIGIETADDLPGPQGGGLEIKIPAGGIPGAPRRRRVGSGVITEADCLAALERFDRELPAGEKRTRKAYKAFATKHGLVSATTIDKRFGGFKSMLERARQRR